MSFADEPARAVGPLEVSRTMYRIVHFASDLMICANDALTGATTHDLVLSDDFTGAALASPNTVAT